MIELGLNSRRIARVATIWKWHECLALWHCVSIRCIEHGDEPEVFREHGLRIGNYRHLIVLRHAQMQQLARLAIGDGRAKLQKGNGGMGNECSNL